MLSLAAACGGGGANGVWWPLETPGHPERLTLLAPAAAAGEEWWQANVLAQLPGAVYSSPLQAQEAQQLIDATNTLRLAHGLSAVQLHPALNQVAQAHALDQATRDYWAHKTPEGLSSRQRIHAACGLTVLSGGENSSISMPGVSTPQEIVEGWSNHPGHRELLFSTQVQYVGAGIYNYAKDENTYYVLLLVSFQP
jgi:uncharacterized protein YkwD